MTPTQHQPTQKLHPRKQFCSRRRRVSSVVEHLSANPKVPGSIPGSWIMMSHVSCILLLEWSTTSQRLWVYRISVPYAHKDPRFLYEERRGQPQEFWSLVLTIDGSTLPQNSYAKHKVTGKTYNKKKKSSL